ncbi:hypothetical protein MSAN_00271500 [Mycena sanguinolenta]|uniref:Protein kinase domain-containing protein n=1 Tax=Mycena sanguinolenta TaxID=230812 RepID=A0A8H7DLF8_9AGAR|nr:hypothetical protein MSAN_00271500 [Mycena sanguinolenta]
MIKYSLPPSTPMDDHPDAEESVSASPTKVASYSGAFFTNSRNLVITGGTFTSHNSIFSPPSDFPRIPFGSIDLRNEIRLDVPAGVVSRNHEQGAVRRMYSARVECRNTPMTVALYQGDDAEEEWRRTVSRHSRFRHPNIIQLCATASSSGIHAAIYHDDLIPHEQFVDSFRHSAILQAYIYAYTIDWKHINIAGLNRVYSPSYPGYITGQLLLPPPDNIQKLRDPKQQSWVIASLTLRQWYSLCYECLAQSRYTDVSPQVEVTVGSIICWPLRCEFEDATEIAWAVPDPDRRLILTPWYHEQLEMFAENGPVRYDSGKIFGSTIRIWLTENPYATPWLSQANYIFTQLKIHSNYNDYVLIHSIEFSLSISIPKQNPPNGYLFLCSPTDFKIGPNSFRWPDFPAYWSLDPWGKEPLSVEEASTLGFPPIERITEVDGTFWDNAVYAGQRKFHEGKGFDPDSQEVALELGYPLYELSILALDVQEEDLALDAYKGRDDSSLRDDDVQDDPCEETHRAVDHPEQTQEIACCGEVIRRHWGFGELVECFKFTLIGVVVAMHLYEHARQSIF